eukprot:1414369-Prymnesium_polylepis.1
MQCAQGAQDPPVAADEVGLSFLFHASGVGADVLSLIRSWGTTADLVGANADAVVLAPARPSLEWVQGAAVAIRQRSSSIVAIGGGGDNASHAFRAANIAPRPPLWLLREHTHVSPSA